MYQMKPGFMTRQMIIGIEANNYGFGNYIVVSDAGCHYV